MAWRPTRYLVQGELDNTKLGRVTGWMEFNGLDERVEFDLEGDFHRDIRGAKIRIRGDSEEEDARGYMASFAEKQTGKVGDITAGLPPQDYVDYPYIEWYGEDNGRVVLELDADQIEVVGMSLPYSECVPVSRKEQEQNLRKFVTGMAREMRAEREKKASMN